AAEQYAEGEIEGELLGQAWVAAYQAFIDAGRTINTEGKLEGAAAAAMSCCERKTFTHRKGDFYEIGSAIATADTIARASGVEKKRADLAAILRDILGNPFHPLMVDPACRTPLVLSLAVAAYDERSLPSGTLDPDRLAILADALE